MQQTTKQRVIGYSVILLFLGLCGLAFVVSMNHKAFRSAGFVLLGFLVGGPFVLRFLIPRILIFFGPWPIQPTAVDDTARRKMLRSIRYKKIWIGVLLICFPLGILNGAQQHIWLPTFVGAGISLLWMYVSVLQIRELRKRLTPDAPSS